MARDRRPERTMVIPAMLGDSPHKPRAAQLQRTVLSSDDTLVGLARSRHPTVAWWWGVRKHDGVMCAWCYLCDRVIVEGALNVGITEAQVDAVDRHRAEHWQDLLQAIKETEAH